MILNGLNFGVCREPNVAAAESLGKTKSINDPIVESVCAKLFERSLCGQAKYGTTLMRDDLDTLDWIRHAQEEAMDMALYLERLYRDIERMIDDGR